MKLNERSLSALFVLPALILILAFYGYPIVQVLISSLTINDGAGVAFGFGNFTKVMGSIRFQSVTINTLRYVCLAVGAEFLLGLVFALLLNTNFKGHQISRTLLLCPLMLAPLVSSLIWKFLLSDQFGLVNWVLYYMGLIESPSSILWISDPRLSLISTVIADVWLTTPFMTLVLLAGMQSIPKDMYESAQIDGANKWETLRHITLPLLRPVATIAVLIRMIDAARQFEITWTLTKGGPHFSSEVISTHIYNTLTRYSRIGEASAMAVIFTMVLMIVGAFFIKRVWSPNKA